MHISSFLSAYEHFNPSDNLIIFFMNLLRCLYKRIVLLNNYKIINSRSARDQRKCFSRYLNACKKLLTNN